MLAFIELEVIIKEIYTHGLGKVTFDSVLRLRGFHNPSLSMNKGLCYKFIYGSCFQIVYDRKKTNVLKKPPI